MADFMNPLDTFKSAYSTGSAILNQRNALADRQAVLDAQAAKDAAAKQAAEVAAAKQAELNAILEKLQKPGATYDDIMKSSMLFPKDQAEALQKAGANIDTAQKAAALQDTMRIASTIDLKRFDMTSDLLLQEAAAERAANNEQGAKYAETLAQQIKDHPENAWAIRTALLQSVVGFPGAKDAMDALNKLTIDRGMNPETALKQAVDTDLLTQAQTAEAWANAFRLQHPPAGSNPAETLMNKAALDVGTAAQAANEANNLADAIDKAKPANGWPTGAVGWATEAVKKAFGSEDAITALKTEYTKIRNYEALKHLPPGAASDKDVTIALDAFPDVNAGPAYIASFMRGIAKLQMYTSNYNKVQAQWIDHNGSLGSAKEPFNVDGVGAIKPGMNYWDAIDKLVMPNVAGTNKTSNKASTNGGEVDF